MFPKNKDDKPNSRLVHQLALYLADLDVAERAKQEAVVRSLVAAAQTKEVADLWEQHKLSVTYWVLLMSGVNQDEEMAIAETLLTWKEFFAKYSAAVRCIPSSDRGEFAFCSSQFKTVNYPSLIFSDVPTMDAYIRLDPQMLWNLAGEKGRLQRFLTKLHQLRESGSDLEKIRAVLLTEQFWSGIKVLYGEVKDFVTVSVDLSSSSP